MRRRILILSFIPFLVLGGLTWFLGQEWTLQWIVQRIVQTSGGNVEIDGVSGSLVNSLQIEKISYTNAEKDIQLTDLKLEWKPWQLLQGQIDIGLISISKLSINLKKSSDEPFKLPQSLASPLSILISEVTLESVNISSYGVGAELKNVHFGLSADESAWHLKELGFDSPFGNAIININLGIQKPFKVDGFIQLDNELTKANVNFKLDGELNRLNLSGNLDGYDAKGHLEAIVTPFAPFMFESVQLKATGIDPSKIESNWPQAQFDAQINIKTNDKQVLNGSIFIKNAKPGSFDENKLPIYLLNTKINGTTSRILLDSLFINMGKAGQFTGEGQFSSKKTELILRTSRFDLHEINSNISSTRISGKISFLDEREKQLFLVELGENRIKMNARVTRVDDLFNLEEILIRAGQSELKASGYFDLKEPQDFLLKGKINRFNFAAFGHFPESSLNLDFNMAGHLKPEWDIKTHYVLQSSRLFNHALSGKGQIEVKGQELRNVDVSLAFGENTFNASGSLGKSSDRLLWKLHAPELNVLGKGYSGALFGEGVLSGSLKSLRNKMSLDGTNILLMGQYSAKKIKVQAECGTELQDKIDTDIQLDDASIGTSHWKLIDIRVNGLLKSHAIEIKTKNEVFDLSAKVVGGLAKNGEWQGKLESLDNRGKLAFSLDSSVPLKVGAGGFSLQNLILQLPEGQLNIQKLIKKNTHIEITGTARGIPLVYLLALSPDSKNTIRSDLTLGADWSLKADRTLDGKIHIYRENGDITLIGDSRIKLGLNTFDIQAILSKNTINIDAQIVSEKAGTIQVHGMTKFVNHNSSWSISKESPLKLSLKADISSIAWMGPLSGQPDMELGGSLVLTVNTQGTLANPKLTGNLTGKDLSVHWLNMGVNLSKGKLSAILSGNRIQIQKGIIYGPEGNLQLNGGIQLKNGQINSDIRFKTNKLLILSNVNRQLAISGQGHISLDQSRLQLIGDWHIDRALIILRDTNNVTYSKDVVVLGRQEKKTDKSIPVRFDLKLNLGNKFYLKGKGIDTRLVGQIHAVSNQDNRLRMFGTINTVDGTYSAFGQKLTIKRGQLTFSGPVENPTLDILAVRVVPNMDNTVEAGVSVKGTAQAPRVRLISTPEVSDTEKLSWLVLGHSGGENGDNQQRIAIAAAAAAILGTEYSRGFPSKLASSIGLDDIGISSSANLEETVLSLNKQISSRLYLTYEQGLTGATNLIKLRYIISKRLSLVGQTGTVTAVDLLYDWRFD